MSIGYRWPNTVLCLASLYCDKCGRLLAWEEGRTAVEAYEKLPTIARCSRCDREQKGKDDE